MKLKFDSNQQYQLDAVDSLVELFDGQPLNKGDFSLELITDSNSRGRSLFQSERGIGNNLVPSPKVIHENLNLIQQKYDLDLMPFSQFTENGLNFSVEMETGTGKTYVYLRTIFELSQKYGFKKFIIVVPSVAIREGTLKNIEVTREHFLALYNNIEFEHFVYDSKKSNRLRQFATSNQLQIMIINIDAFRKDFSDSEDDRKSNVIFKESDKLSGHKPIEFVQATNPIVIIDEPQSVDNTPKAKEAIKSLNPLCVFRFSATHRNLFNQVYKLDPVKAFELKLVKQIVVAEVSGSGAHNDAYLKLLAVDNKKGIKARIRIHVQAKAGVTEKDIWVRQNADIFALSNERAAYKNGFEVLEISAEPGNEYIDFNSGRLELGQERGGLRDDISDVQIRNTIKKHLDKELQVKGRGIKILSLFFIDRVANYRSYNGEGKAIPGKFAALFEKHYQELIKLPQYKHLDTFPVHKIHDGYFSQDKKGIAKDTSGSTKDDDDTYAKIMRNKEQLLSLEEPLKFIFSHSALREGWDNPNVFQICTLNETRSGMKKRQEIGRGLRLPVDQSGARVFDDNLNKLTIIANESYEEFAKNLQTEYEEDCGVTFGRIPVFAFSKVNRIVEETEQTVGREKSEQIWTELSRNGFIDDKGRIQSKFTPEVKGFSLNLSPEFTDIEQDIISTMQAYRLDRHIKRDEEPRKLRFKSPKELTEQDLNEDFEQLWNRIKHRTTYQVKFTTEELVAHCVKAITKMDKIAPVRIIYREGQLQVQKKGVVAEEIRFSETDVVYRGPLPDLLSYIQRETELTRKTIYEIIMKSGRLAEFLINPQKYMDSIVGIIRAELHRLMIDGIKYEKIADQEWSMQLFKDNEILCYLNNRLEVKKSVYDAVVYDSEIERNFAEELDKREDIKLFVKLPSWFIVETPIGEYNPDWAIVKHTEQTIYLVKETKGTKDFLKLRNSETDKVRCGAAHFKVLGMELTVVTHAGEV